MKKNDMAIRLLLVDDEQGFATVLAKRMSKRGLQVETAFKGEDAVRILRDSEFDIAILDLKLEGMDGLEILKVFKLLDPEMPVVMLTGHGCEAAAKESMKIGAADYLSKPTDFDHLMSKIMSVCGQ